MIPIHPGWIDHICSAWFGKTAQALKTRHGSLGLIPLRYQRLSKHSTLAALRLFFQRSSQSEPLFVSPCCRRALGLGRWCWCPCYRFPLSNPHLHLPSSVFHLPCWLDIPSIPSLSFGPSSGLFLCSSTSSIASFFSAFNCRRALYGLLIMICFPLAV